MAHRKSNKFNFDCSKHEDPRSYGHHFFSHDDSNLRKDEERLKESRFEKWLNIGRIKEGWKDRWARCKESAARRLGRRKKEQ